MIPKYSINLLHSAARWLAGKSGTVWAIECGHQSLMNSYSKDLTELAAHLQADRQTCKGCGGLIGAPLGREPDPMDCACCSKVTVPDEAELLKQREEMAMLLRRCIFKLGRLGRDDVLQKQVHQYLVDRKLMGNILRGYDE